VAAACGGSDTTTGQDNQNQSTCQCTASVNGIERQWQGCGTVECIDGTSYACGEQGVSPQGTCAAPDAGGEPDAGGDTPDAGDPDAGTASHACDDLATHCDQCQGDFQASCWDRVNAANDTACAYFWANSASYCQ
jgi:hypothetical protein